jgi:chromosome segregation ATPase
LITIKNLNLTFNKIEGERKNFENQVKELKKKHFFVENELEKKSNILLKLLEDNKNLKAKNNELLSQTLTQIKSKETNLENFLLQKESGGPDNYQDLSGKFGK